MTSRRLALALLALLCMAAVVPTGPASAQSGGGRPDLAVTRLAITGPAPGWTNGAGNSTTVEATVANVGTAPSAYQVDYRWIGADGSSMPLNGFGDSGVIGYSSVDVSRTPLGPGEQRVHRVTWRLQPGQEGNGTLLASVSLADADGTTPQATEPDYGNNARRLPTFVPVRDVSVTVLDRPSVAEPGARGFFRLTVRNDGNRPAPVAFSLVNPPQDARLRPSFDPPRLTVPPASSSNATLYVDYRPDGDFRPFSLTYTVEADPGYLPRQRLTTPRLVNGSEEPSTAGFAFGLARPQEGPVATSRGSWTNATLVLRNNGTRADTYVLSAVPDPAAWSAAMEPRNVSLYPGESAAVRLRLRAPATAPVGASAFVNVSAQASLLPAAAVRGVPAFIPGAQLAVTSLRLEDPVPYTGDSPVLVATVANEGEEAAHPGAVLRFAWTVPGAGASSQADLLPALAPGETLTHAVTLPPLAAGGPMTAEAAVQSAEGATSPSLRVSAFVHEAVLGLQGPAVELEGNPGETVVYQLVPSAFRLHNLGNAVEAYSVEAFSDLGSAAVEGSPLAFGPGENRTVRVLHTLPFGTPNGTAATLTVTVRLANRPEHSWFAVASTRIVDREPPLLRFDPALPSLWNLQTPLSILLHAEDAGGLGDVGLAMTDPGGNLTELALVPAGPGAWAAEVTLATPGNHTFRATAEDASGNAANATPSVRAERVPPPRLRLQGSMPAAVNATDRFRVLVDDALPIARVTLEIRQGTNVTRRDLPVEEGAVEFDLKGARAGPAHVQVEAVNAAGASSPLAFQVEVAGEPGAGTAPPGGREAPGPALLPLAALALAALGRRRRKGWL